MTVSRTTLARFLTALHRCNNGGHVVFQQDTTYIIGKALDLTFLKQIDNKQESAKSAHGFQFGFQNVTTFFKMGGEDVLMYGARDSDSGSLKATDESEEYGTPANVTCRAR
ncbi:hypothetical protein B0T19DRAFT_443008 [Cercophora scortea]|uniref:Uncharacterized protein n=1 Tax=Cercophora scortea TaxID=314031 RepID=A0AAE0IEN5_9PEZI|nr:hypothetical protein B0T19DRAFT_443008 [Cercophora scortea]